MVKINMKQINKMGKVNTDENPCRELETAQL